MTRQRIQELEQTHGLRRGWVWSRQGQAPLAQALAHLQTLAASAAHSPGGVTPAAIAREYATTGWQVVGAVLQALAVVRSAEDVAAVSAPIRALYRPWLEQAAFAMQQAHAPSLSGAQRHPP